MKVAQIAASAFLFLCCGMPLSSTSDLANANDDAAVLVHYMPWYASKPISGAWGWHWTMNHFDPAAIGADERREIASHYYPLIGPYDSNDPHALECQVLLMKFAGVDGVIVDWYGIEDYYDYAALHANTQHLVTHIKKAGLRFAVCYEDQTIKHMVAGGALSADRAVDHGREVMRWLQAHWFTDDVYLKVDGRPLLLVFGPQYFGDEAWDQLFADLPQRPYFFTLNTRRPGADGAFGWPPVHGGGEIPASDWRAYLDRLYTDGEDALIGAAFPKFHDIYAEAGLHDSYGYLDDRDGTVFAETLERAAESASRLIQIATWNDYGEGTTIEPTREFGYRYLEELQAFRKHRTGGTFPYSPEDLRLPVQLYALRKDAATDLDLDKVAALLFASDLEAARQFMSEAAAPNAE